MRWTERDNCYSVQIGKFKAHVNWAMTGGGYEASFAGTKLTEKFADVNDAKRAAIALARKTLSEALAALDS